MVDMIQAILSGDIDGVKEALAQGASPNTKGQDGLYAIHIAAMANQPKIFDVLINGHAFINAKDPHNNTALYYAARQGGSREFVQKIIDYGSEINAQNKLGQTASHVAARVGNVGALQALLKSGANISIKDIVGKTPLHDAIKTNHPEHILLLLEYGASTKIKDNTNSTAMDLAKASTNPVTKDLMSMPIISKIQIPAHDVLFEATITGNKAAVENALTHGTSPNTINAAGMTGIHFAALHGDAAMLKVFVDHGGIINQTDYQGMQAIHYAAFTHQTDLVDTLVANKVSMNAMDYQGNTPIHYASLQVEGSAFIEKLLSNGADIDSQNKVGDTALHLAAADGNLAVVKTLVEHHAKLDLSNNHGETALQEAIKTHHQDIADYLSSQSKAADDDDANLQPLTTPTTGKGTLSLADVVSNEKDLLKLFDKSDLPSHTKENIEPVAGPYHAHVSHEELAPIHVDQIL